MPASRLTLAHKAAQTRIAVATVQSMRSTWGTLNPDRLDASFPDWLDRAVPVIEANRAKSTQLAAAYLTAFKRSGPPVFELAAPLDSSAVATSLLVTGPVSVKRAMARGVPLVRAMSVAEASSAAAASRFALEGGRDTIQRSLAADEDARGWQRVASGNSCRFCAVLDGKFHWAETADFPAHDGCTCSQEPVYGERRVSERSLAARG